MAVQFVLKEKITKTVLRYPGGKFRAAKTIINLMPKTTTKLCSPFLGGGSIELACARNNIKVFGYDIFSPLIEFWQCLMSNPVKLANIVEKYHPLSKSKFYNLQKTQNKSKSKYERAGIFYVLNRSSFSGSTLSGGMSPGHARFNKAAINRIRSFRIENFTVQKLDFRDSLPKHQDAFVYLDPPYMIAHKLYGVKGNTHKNFDHEELAKILKNRDNWILSYNNSESVHKLYSEYTFYYPDWKYGMSSEKKSSEVLILSHDIAKYNKDLGKLDI